MKSQISKSLNFKVKRQSSRHVTVVESQKAEQLLL